VTVVGFDRRAEGMASALHLARQVNFRGPIPATLDPDAQDAPERIATAAAACRTRGLPKLLWVSLTGRPVPAGVRSVIRETDGYLAAVIDPLTKEDVLEGAGTAVYNIQSQRGRAVLEGRSAKDRNRVEWITWDPAAETPLRNRLYAGFLLWKSGFGGAYWRADESERFWSPRSPDFRHLEALGEGIEDARYLTVLYAMIRQIRDMNRSHPLPDKAESRVRSALARLSADATGGQVNAVRQQITADILACQAVLR
jgi:hypothetical protein